jgi:FkbM family methyltransferase
LTTKSAARSLAARLGLTVDRWPARGTLEELIRAVLRTYAVDCVIDVGANEGQFAGTLRRLGYEGHIISFEPVAAAFEVLERRASTDPRWAVKNLAIGNQSGEVEINVAGSTAVSSILRFNVDISEAFGEERGAAVREETTCRHVQRVAMAALDELDLPGERIYLKTDTQGYDLEVLEGCPVLLERRVPAVQAEISFLPLYYGMRNQLQAVSTCLHEYGFELGGLFSISRDAYQRQVEMDGVFVRRG